MHRKLRSSKVSSLPELQAGKNEAFHYGAKMAASKTTLPNSWRGNLFPAHR